MSPCSAVQGQEKFVTSEGRVVILRTRVMACGLQ